MRPLTNKEKLAALEALLSDHEAAGAQILSSFATHIIRSYAVFVNKKGWHLTGPQQRILDSLYEEHILRHIK